MAALFVTDERMEIEDVYKLLWWAKAWRDGMQPTGSYMARDGLDKYKYSDCPSRLMDHGSPTITTLSIVLHNGQSDVNVVSGDVHLLRLMRNKGKALKER